MPLAVHYFGEKKNPPLLFLHGLLGSTEDFKAMISHLSSDFYCIGIDLPGFGRSKALKELSFEIMTCLLYETICNLHLQSLSVVGYSLGGRLSMLLEYTYPSLFNKVIILSAHPGLSCQNEKKAHEENEKKWLKILQEASLETFLEMWYSQDLFRGVNLKGLAYSRRHLEPYSIINTIEALSLLKQKPLWDHLAQTHTPHLFICGEEDIKYRDLYKKLPASCEKYICARSSHQVHLQQPKVCAECVFDFLKK